MRIAAAQILSGRDPQDNLRQVRERVADILIPLSVNGSSRRMDP